MADTTIKGEIIKDLLSEFPEAGSKTIARIAYRDNREVFIDIENARSAVRYYRGNIGRKNRDNVSDDEHVREPQEPGDPFGELPEPVDLPDTEAIRVTGSKVLVLSDMHVPYHDLDALEKALDYGEEQNIDSIIFNGDAADFFEVSVWQKDPRKCDLGGGLEKTRQVFGYIRNRFGGIPIRFKLGNHEERWERYLYAKAPEVVGVSDFEIHKILRLEDFEISHATRMQHYKIGHLSVLHGHEFGRSFWNPVNPARGLFLRAKATAMCGHYHQSSEHIEPNMNGEITGCWSTGCLCHLKPEYAPYNKWSLGFAIVTNDETGFSVENKKIIDGRVR